MIIESYLDGKRAVSPIELSELSLSLTFGVTVQPDIENKTFRFVKQDKQLIDSWIARGGIFEGIPFSIIVRNSNESIIAFEGILDLTTIEVIDDNQIECSVKQVDGLNHINDRIEGITFGFLANEGIITSSDYVDVDFIVEKENTLLDLAIISLSTYMLLNQIYTATKDELETAATGSGIAASGVTAAVGSTLYLGLSIAAKVAYYALILIQLRNLANSLFRFLLPETGTHKALRLQTGLEKIGQYLGYEVQIGLDLSNIVLLPSNNSEEGEITEGFPSASDYGFVVSEYIGLLNQLYNTKFAVIDGRIHLRNEDDTYWDKLATYNIPETEEMESFNYNSSELVGSYLYRFATDPNDVWTQKNIGGTIFTNKSYPRTFTEEKNILIKGYNRIEIPYSLGNRKEGLSTSENAVKGLLKVVDILTGVFSFGNGTNFASKIQSRIGNLKVSSKFHSVPKILYMNGTKLNSRHRNLFNAEILFTTHHRSKLLSTDNYKNQYKVRNEKTIPFGFSDLLKMQKTDRAYFNGSTVRVTELKFIADKNVATISFKEPFVYSRNIKEIQS